MKKSALILGNFLFFASLATGCGNSSIIASNGSESKLNETSDPSSAANAPYQNDGKMKNTELTAVPADFYSSSAHQGRLESFAYETKNYLGDESAISKQATVYLPYGYEQNDENTRYDILYLQHGAYGNQNTWMHEYGNDFKNMVDNMIDDGLIPPLIIVMPYLTSGNQWYHDTVPIFYGGEIKNDLMPAIENRYHTFANEVTDLGFKESRSHRAFGGFSAGSTTTWNVFNEGIDRFKYFMPLSGGLTLGGDGSSSDDDAKRLADAAVASGYEKNEYYIFSATGTSDVAYQGLTAQIESMKVLTNAFAYTETGFEDGNLMYYTAEGNRHDYQYTYEYVFNGLQCLFSWH